MPCPEGELDVWVFGTTCDEARPCFLHAVLDTVTSKKYVMSESPLVRGQDTCHIADGQRLTQRFTFATSALIFVLH